MVHEETIANPYVEFIYLPEIDMVQLMVWRDDTKTEALHQLNMWRDQWLAMVDALDGVFPHA